MTIDDYILYQTEQIFEYKFRSYQVKAAKKIIKSVVNAEMLEIPLNWSRQVGKTDLCKICLTLALFLPLMSATPSWSAKYQNLHRFKKGLSVGFVGPLEWQSKVPLKKIASEFNVQPRLHSALRQLGIEKTVDNTKEMCFSNGSKFDTHTANQGAGKPAGTYHILWFTEAQSLSTYSVRSIFSPTLASTQGTKVFDGTAEAFRNDFYDVIQRERAANPRDNSITIPYDRAGREVPGYLDYVAKEIPRIAGGTNSPFFKLNYMLQWVGGGGSLISYDTFHSCYGNFKRGEFAKGKKDTTGNIIPPKVRYCFGIDFAKVRDKTVVVMAEFHHSYFRVVDLFEIWQISHSEQNDIIVEWIKSKGVKNAFLACDSTGVGDARVDDLRVKIPKYYIEEIAYTASIKDTMYKLFNQYTSDLSRRVEWYTPEEGDPEAAEFEREVVDCVVEAKGNNMFTFHAKTVKGDDQISQPHDDYVCALMNCIYAFENTINCGGFGF